LVERKSEGRIIQTTPGRTKKKEGLGNFGGTQKNGNQCENTNKEREGSRTTKKKKNRGRGQERMIFIKFASPTEKGGGTEVKKTRKQKRSEKGV